MLQLIKDDNPFQGITQRGQLDICFPVGVLIHTFLANIYPERVYGKLKLHQKRKKEITFPPYKKNFEHNMAFIKLLTLYKLSS